MSDTLPQTADALSTDNADTLSTDAADALFNEDDGALSTEEIRSHFPALTREHEGRAVAYFDGPGGTQVPRRVVESVSDYLYHHNANTHWAYPTRAETEDRKSTRLNSSHANISYAVFCLKKKKKKIEHKMR